MPGGADETSVMVRPFDWPWDANEVIWPCHRCVVWRAQLIFEGPHDAIWVREWHAMDCAIWAEVEGLTD